MGKEQDSGIAADNLFISPRCYFTSIAPELRNAIYAAVFKIKAEALLLESKPPEKARLLTQRKVYDEAIGMFGAAYRKYWSEASVFHGSNVTQVCTC